MLTQVSQAVKLSGFLVKHGHTAYLNNLVVVNLVAVNNQKVAIQFSFIPYITQIPVAVSFCINSHARTINLIQTS